MPPQASGAATDVVSTSHPPQSTAQSARGASNMTLTKPCPNIASGVCREPCGDDYCAEQAVCCEGCGPTDPDALIFLTNASWTAIRCRRCAVHLLTSLDMPEGERADD